MRKNIYKIVSMVMTSAVIISGAGFAGMVQTPVIVSAETKQETEDKILDEIKNTVKISENPVDKDETVYVITDANGNVSKKIVSDHLFNNDGAKTIEDKTDLSDIENVKSDADYTKNGDDSITWNTDGEDVYYQGTTDKELPVDVKVTYYLDGDEIDPSDLAGKSGSVKIRFDYTNNTSVKTKVGDEDVEMKVPFTMISGMILSEDFSNIEVSNGKVINQGGGNIVIGYAMPGLKEDLNNVIGEEKGIEIPDYVEVTADVKDFSLLTTVTVASADLLSDVSLDTSKTREDIDSVIDELTSAMDQLKDGSTKLSDGTSELRSKFTEYKDGITAVIDAIAAIDDGATKLSGNMKKVVNGAKAISDGVGTLSAAFEGEEGLKNGVKKLDDGAKALNNGIDTLSKSVGDEKDVNTLAGGVSALSQGADTLSKAVGSTDSKTVAKDAASGNPKTVAGAVLALLNGSKQLDSGIDQLAEGINGTKKQTGLADGIHQVKTAVGSSDAKTAAKDAASGKPATLAGGAYAVDAGVGELVDGMTQMTKSISDSIADNEAKIKKLTDAVTYIKTYGVDPTTGTQLNEQQITAMVTEYSGNIAALKGANQALSTVIAQMNEKDLSGNLTKLKAGTSSLKDSTLQLAGGMEQLDAGATKLKAGVTKLDNGSGSLVKGLDALNKKIPQLTSGTKQLADGLSALCSKIPQLKAGVNALLAGSKQLADGTGKLDAGVTTMYSKVKNDLGGGAKELYNGTVEFDSYLSQLSDGTGKLNSKMGTLSEGTDKLEDGIAKLDDGAGKLDEGIATLTDEAVGGAVDTYNNDVIPAMDRVEGTLEAAKSYNIYSQAADGKTSRVKFIYRTDSIE